MTERSIATLKKYRHLPGSLRFLLGYATLWFLLSQNLLAQTRTVQLSPLQDPRGDPELVVCSQNLENYGSLESIRRKEPGTKASDFRAKEKALIKRFADVGCDVIAVQELLGKNELEAREALESLALQLRKLTNRFYAVHTGASNDQNLRNGFLVAQDRAEVLSTISYADVELPKILPDQKPRSFPRGPLEIQLQVKPRGESVSKNVTLVNFHFKSHAGSADDPTGLQYETYRMEMAEGLRRVVEHRFSQSFASGETLLLLLGDRNSHWDTASAKILEGSLTLKQFQENAPCRLSKRGLPLCKAGIVLPQRLFSVLTEDPQIKNIPGTFHFKNVYYWLDDILMPAESLPFAKANAFQEGDYESGVLSVPEIASDHSMVFVKLNW